MKKVILLLSIFSAAISYAQEEVDTIRVEETDTIRFNMGKKKVVVITTGELDTLKKEDEVDKREYAHWAGIGASFNFFVNDNYAIADKDDAFFLEIDFNRSASLNANVFEKRFPIVKEYVGLTTGLGFQLSFYELKNNVNINVTNDSTYGVLNETIDFSRNRLQLFYVQVPLLLEFNTSKNPEKNWHFSFGVTGAYKMGSSYRTKWKADGEKYKDKMRSNFNMNPFQAYGTAIVGYGNYSAFIHYGLTPLFEKGKGPNFVPVNIGVLCNF